MTTIERTNNTISTHHFRGKKFKTTALVKKKHFVTPNSCRNMSTFIFWNGPSIKPGTWNFPEHPGTFRNIPEHRIIIIIMRRICKIKFSTIKWNKNKLVSAWKIKRTKKQNKTKQRSNKTNSNGRKKKEKWKCVHWAKARNSKLIATSFSRVRHQFSCVTVSYS